MLRNVTYKYKTKREKIHKCTQLPTLLMYKLQASRCTPDDTFSKLQFSPSVVRYVLGYMAMYNSGDSDLGFSGLSRAQQPLDAGRMLKHRITCVNLSLRKQALVGQEQVRTLG